MPKVTGPLFSLHASGTLRKALTFGVNAGRDVVRAYALPKNPDSPAQQTQRARVQAAAAGWRSLGAGDKTAWQTAAAAVTSNGYAYFVRQWHLQDIAPPYLPSIP